MKTSRCWLSIGILIAAFSICAIRSYADPILNVNLTQVGDQITLNFSVTNVDDPSFAVAAFGQVFMPPEFSGLIDHPFLGWWSEVKDVTIHGTIEDGWTDQQPGTGTVSDDGGSYFLQGNFRYKYLFTTGVHDLTVRYYDDPSKFGGPFSPDGQQGNGKFTALTTTFTIQAVPDRGDLALMLLAPLLAVLVRGKRHQKLVRG